MTRDHCAGHAGVALPATVENNRLCMRNEILRSANDKFNFSFNKMNKKDVPAMYSTVFWCLIVVLLVFMPLLHNHCYSLHETKWRLVISIWQCPGPVATRMPYFRQNSNPLQIVSANCHFGDVSNFKCTLVDKHVITGTGRKLDVPRRPAQMTRFDAEIFKAFSNCIWELH